MGPGLYAYTMREVALLHYFDYTPLPSRQQPPFAPGKFFGKRGVKGVLKRLDAQLGGTPMAEIAADYYGGTIRFPDEGNKYWYWIEVMCGRERHPLPNEFWNPSGDALDLLSGPSFLDPTVQAPWPAPRKVDPQVRRVPWASLDAAQAHVTGLAREGRLSWGAQTEFEGWVREAKRVVMDLYLFHY